MDFISPSRLVCEALSLGPVGSEEAPEDSRCGMCGGEIPKGEPVTPLKFPSSFTLYGELFDQNAPFRCGHCSQIYETGPFLLDLGTGIYSKDGFIPVAKKANRGWAFTCPPEPPFAFAIQVNRNQHTLWRTPVCYSQDLVTFRLGETICNVRRPALLAAAEASRKIQSIWFDQQSESRKKADKKLPSPLGFSELKGAALKIGEMQGWVMKMIENNLITENDIEPLTQLNNAEAWALDFMLSDIEAPTLITSFTEYLDRKSQK